MVFLVVMYGCESWTIKKAEHQRIDACELWCWRRLLRVPWTARRSNQTILKEISPECSLEGLMLKMKLHPVWDSLGFLDLGDYFLPHFREVFNYYLLKYFFMVFLFVFFFWDSFDSNVGRLTLSQRSLRLSLFILICFSFFLSDSFISTILSAAAAAMSLQSCLTLCDPIDGSPPGSPVPGILSSTSRQVILN